MMALCVVNCQSATTTTERIPGSVEHPPLPQQQQKQPPREGANTKTMMQVADQVQALWRSPLLTDESKLCALVLSTRQQQSLSKDRKELEGGNDDGMLWTNEWIHWTLRLLQQQPQHQPPAKPLLPDNGSSNSSCASDNINMPLLYARLVAQSLGVVLSSQQQQQQSLQHQPSSSSLSTIVDALVPFLSMNTVTATSASAVMVVDVAVCDILDAVTLWCDRHRGCGEVDAVDNLLGRVFEVLAYISPPRYNNNSSSSTTSTNRTNDNDPTRLMHQTVTALLDQTSHYCDAAWCDDSTSNPTTTAKDSSSSTSSNGVAAALQQLFVTHASVKRTDPPRWYTRWHASSPSDSSTTTRHHHPVWMEIICRTILIPSSSVNHNDDDDNDNITNNTTQPCGWTIPLDDRLLSRLVPCLTVDDAEMRRLAWQAAATLIDRPGASSSCWLQTPSIIKEKDNVGASKQKPTQTTRHDWGTASKLRCTLVRLAAGEAKLHWATAYDRSIESSSSSRWSKNNNTNRNETDESDWTILQCCTHILVRTVEQICDWAAADDFSKDGMAVTGLSGDAVLHLRTSLHEALDASAQYLSLSDPPTTTTTVSQDHAFATLTSSDGSDGGTNRRPQRYPAVDTAALRVLAVTLTEIDLFAPTVQGVGPSGRPSSSSEASLDASVCLAALRAALRLTTTLVTRPLVGPTTNHHSSSNSRLEAHELLLPALATVLASAEGEATTVQLLDDYDLLSDAMLGGFLESYWTLVNATLLLRVYDNHGTDSATTPASRTPENTGVSPTSSNNTASPSSLVWACDLLDLWMSMISGGVVVIAVNTTRLQKSLLRLCETVVSKSTTSATTIELRSVMPAVVGCYATLQGDETPTDAEAAVVQRVLEWCAPAAAATK